MKRKAVEIGQYGVNPFVSALVVPVSRRMEIKGGVIESEDLERTEYAKIFRTVECRELMFSMSGMGNKLFNYICHRLESGQDIITMNSALFSDYLGVRSNKSFYTAAIELQRLGIISPVAGVKGKYWVNPSILFVGSRINKYPENVVVKSTTTKRK